MTAPRYVWVSIPCSPDLAKRMTKAANHLGISRAELIRLSTAKFMRDNDLWSIPGPLRTGGDQRPPRADADELRQEVTVDE